MKFRLLYYDEVYVLNHGDGHQFSADEFYKHLDCGNFHKIVAFLTQCAKMDIIEFKADLGRFPGYYEQRWVLVPVDISLFKKN